MSATTALATADLGDAHPSLLATGDLRALQPIFNSYGLKRAFHGRAVTLKTFEDNTLVHQLFRSAPPHGPGSVLVIDGGGSLRRAVVGGNLAKRASDNGWAGIVVNGCIRDVEDINACDIGVRALGVHPLKPSKGGYCEKHVPVSFAGVRIEDGEWVYVDMDGILVSKTQLSLHS